MLIELIAQWAEERDYETKLVQQIWGLPYRGLTVTRKDGSQHCFIEQSIGWIPSMRAKDYCAIYIVTDDYVEVHKHRWAHKKNDHFRAAHPKFLTWLSEYVTWGEK